MDWKIIQRILNSQLRVLYRAQQGNKQTIWGIVNFIFLWLYMNATIHSKQKAWKMVALLQQFKIISEKDGFLILPFSSQKESFA